MIIETQWLSQSIGFIESAYSPKPTGRELVLRKIETRWWGGKLLSRRLVAKSISIKESNTIEQALWQNAVFDYSSDLPGAANKTEAIGELLQPSGMIKQSNARVEILNMPNMQIWNPESNPHRHPEVGATIKTLQFVNAVLITFLNLPKVNLKTKERELFWIDPLCPITDPQRPAPGFKQVRIIWKLSSLIREAASLSADELSVMFIEIRDGFGESADRWHFSKTRVQMFFQAFYPSHTVWRQTASVTLAAIPTDALSAHGV